jgi:multidrug efflux pump subunit AcrB
VTLPSLKNPIRLFAVLCVGCIAGFIMWTASWVLAVLASPGWCRTALGAEKVSGSDGTIKGLDACVGLLTIQLKALAANSYIFGGVMALCLLVLIVIVIAGAKLDVLANKDGVHALMSRDAPAAAQQVADRAQDAADTIKDATP